MVLDYSSFMFMYSRADIYTIDGHGQSATTSNALPTAARNVRSK
ncbi:hypothetical protein COLO4_16760 [Corchorus olitorius]|uniref:Uncharacterized protein n=1 Tax=Corchorus olitorius TaxID=93759 RepID=A0A1R3JFR0_9ROSI|nr:hypothetical protein COLO4_16760 [Corchorus olitorius]